MLQIVHMFSSSGFLHDLLKVITLSLQEVRILIFNVAATCSHLQVAAKWLQVTATSVQRIS